jgi:tetratricopeptide (TPR) repeat protein
VSDQRSALGDVPEETLRDEATRWQLARSGCPDPDLLLTRRSELLEPDVRAALDDHVASCEACARLASDLDAMKLETADATTEAAILSRVQQRRATAPAWRLPLAAALILGCTASMAWWMRSAPSAPSAPSASSPPSPPSAPSPIVAMWTVEALPVRVSLSAVGVSRSGESPTAGAALVEALAPYQAGHYADAIPALQDVARAHPESGDAALYLGVALLLADRPREALPPLERAATQVEPSRRPDVEWYRATAEQRAGQTPAARDRLAALCATRSDYQQRACAAAQALR